MSSLTSTKEVQLPTFSPVTKEGKMSIFCCSLPYTWNGDGDGESPLVIHLDGDGDTHGW